MPNVRVRKLQEDMRNDHCAMNQETQPLPVIVFGVVFGVVSWGRYGVWGCLDEEALKGSLRRPRKRSLVLDRAAIGGSGPPRTSMGFGVLTWERLALLYSKLIDHRGNRRCNIKARSRCNQENIKARRHSHCKCTQNSQNRILTEKKAGQSLHRELSSRTYHDLYYFTLFGQ